MYGLPAKDGRVEKHVGNDEEGVEDYEEDCVAHEVVVQLDVAAAHKVQVLLQDNVWKKVWP